MRFKNTKTGILFGLIIAAVIIVAFAISNTLQTTTDSTDNTTTDTITGLSGEVKIGLITPLTGDLSTHGNENYEASKLAVSDFNEHLKEIGEPWHITMISEDSATNPVLALEKLASLNAKGIKAVLGPETSSNVRNIIGYADYNNMLLVSCCSTAPALAIPNDSVYRLVPDDTNQGAALAKLLDSQGIDVVIPVYRGDTWGDGLKDATAQSFLSGDKIVDDGIRYNPESPEFSASTSLLSKKVQEYVDKYGTDKVAVLYLGFAEVLQFMQSSSQHDILDDVRWFGPGATTKEYSLINDPIGLEFSNTIKFTTVQMAVSANPTYQHVQDYLVDSFGRAPSTFAHSSYDAVWVVGLSILESQSSDISDIKNILPSVADNYSGAIGNTKLNDAGDLANADYEVWGIRDGAWVLLGQYDYADGTITLIK